MALPRSAVLGVFVGMPLSAIFLWLAVRNAELDEVWTVVRDADIVFLALAVVVLAAVYLGQALRWRGIARVDSVSPARFAEMVVCAAAANNVLPGRVGDLLRARWLQVSAAIAGGRALASVFVDRAYDVVVLAVLLLVSLPFVADADWLRWIAVASVVLVAGVVATLVGARLYSQRARGREIHRGRVRRFVSDIIEGLSEPLGLPRAAVLAAGSFLVWMQCAVAVWLVATAVGVGLSPVEALFVATVLNLGVAIPSAPGFVGTYQWLGVSALALLEVGTEEALAFAILMHAVWYVPTTVLGGVLLARRYVRALAGPARRARAPELGKAESTR